MAKKKDKKRLPAQSNNSFDEKQQQYDDLVEQCLRIIKNSNIFFITDLVAFLPISRTTFYKYGLDKSDTLKDAINRQKIFTKQSLRNQWLKSNNPAVQIALYKIICTEEERNAISNYHNQQKNEQKEIGENLINVLRQLHDGD